MMRYHVESWTYTLMTALLVLLLPHSADAAVTRKVFTTTSDYLVVEILDDDLIHIEASAAGPAPPANQPLYTSPMVLKTDYAGPSMISDQGSTLETADIRIEVSPANL